MKSQKKYKSSPIIEKYTNVENYDAHEEQLKEIMNFITKDNYSDMKNRLCKNYSKFSDFGSSNFGNLFQKLESSDFSWLKKSNEKLLSK